MNPSSFSELGMFNVSYSRPRVDGVGISASSNHAVLQVAAQYALRHDARLNLGAIARAALAAERRGAGAALAAQDVFPIVYGGLCSIRTRPSSGRGEVVRPGDVLARQIPCDRGWLSRHVILAFDPSAKRHVVPELLAGLFSHSHGGRFVSEMSGLAQLAAKAISACDIEGLAVQIRQYVDLFDAWSLNRYSAYTAPMARRLARALGHDLLAWKPPGGGGAKAIAALLRTEESRSKVLDFFSNSGWWATPLSVTGGLSAAAIGPRQYRVSAGFRFDFIGAADLGADSRIGVPGECIACAIEPRAELTVRSESPFRFPPVAPVSPPVNGTHRAFPSRSTELLLPAS